MSPSFLPYDPRWTAKLLRRDVRNLKAKAFTKMKSRFARSSKPSPSDAHVDIAEPEGPQVSSRAASLVGSARPSTLYELLEAHLEAMWASRDRNMSQKERWNFRGSWLALYNAVQACPSNPCYDVFESPKVDETALLLELLDLSTSKASSRGRLSKTPAAPYEGNKNHRRVDSVWSTGSSIELLMPTPTTPQLWHGILEAVTDELRITPIAEELLMLIWPEKNAAEILDDIGDPSKVFRDDDELRLRLRDLLFPSYTTLSASRQ